MILALHSKYYDTGNVQKDTRAMMAFLVASKRDAFKELHVVLPPTVGNTDRYQPKNYSSYLYTAI